MAPRSRADLAVPADVPLVDLLPTLLDYTGAGADETGRRVGWALSRVGGAELDHGRTPAELAIRDGEVLLLRPRGDATPVTVFEDVVDALASGTRQRRGRWGPASSRAAGLVGAVGALLAGAVGLLFAGPPYRPAGLVALGLAALLVVVAIVYARALGAARAGASFAVVAVIYAGLGALLAVADDLGQLTLAPVAVAATAAVVTAAVASAGVPATAPVFLAGSVCVVAVPAALAVAALLDTGLAAGAAAVALAAYAFLPAMPMLAYRFAGLPRPSVPSEREHLRQETEIVDAAHVLVLGRRADAYLASMLGALAALSAAAAILVVTAGLPGLLMAAVLAILPVLRSRWFVVRMQRLPLLLSGAVALVAVATVVYLRADGDTRLVGTGVVVLGVVLLSISVGLAGERPAAPRWGRLLDIAEIVFILALAPLAVWLSGILDAVRAIRG